MMDPTISAAFSVASKKGAYALVLGSGVSRSAQIPTGWEIVLDLISRIAQVAGKDCGADPAGWYREEYGKEPDYSELLGILCKSPDDRSAILRRYFEPTEEEREQGVKMPMPAHRAIADLIAAGYVRVVVTTNFDHLLEQALQERAIAPTVISTADQAQGALPLVHNNCTIIKVNGDYLDTRIKNTSEELGNYDPRMNSLLDQVFDEYGLIFCGWSAAWDTALCAALERGRSRRFTSFWCKRGQIEDAANRVVNFRFAELIDIKDADSFFQDLAAKVAGIEQFDKPHPLSAKLATVMVKRYLVHERDRIVLHDLVTDETEKVCAQLMESHFPAATPVSNEEFVKRVHRYEVISEVLLAVLATGCFWGNRHQRVLWAKSLERVANAMDFRSGVPLWNNLRLYPALLLLYAGGVAAIANSNYETLATYLTQPKYSGVQGKSQLLRKLNWLAVVESSPDAPNLLFADGRKRRLPMSDYLHIYLRPMLREFVPSDEDYDEAFDRFEYTFAMVWMDENQTNGWAPMGRFVRDYSIFSEIASPGQQIGKLIDIEVERDKENWLPLRAGFFGGSLERFVAVKQKLDGLVAYSSRYS